MLIKTDFFLFKIVVSIHGKETRKNYLKDLFQCKERKGLQT